jgi:NRAMP (natural resistance-associated macrophage protein)-like metal ion transporter
MQASKQVLAEEPGKPSSARQFFADLGPGLITGAADDDPSGISTYSMAGASFGYATLWTALLSFPLMAAVQIMCARLGMVSGRGLAGVVRRRYPRWILWGSCLLLMVANVVNIGADLGGMGEVTQMMSGVSAYVWTPFYACSIIASMFWLSYRRIAGIFKWLTLVLFAYVITAFLANADWGAVLRATLLPRIEWSRGYIAVLVAIFGTTISPYLFFWQAAQEVEEERGMGRSLRQRKGATKEELRKARTDVVFGMFVSNLIMYFIILTAAATLHAHGQNQIATALQAAEALRPLAGGGAYLLFTVGLIGTGILGVPVLAGSCAYAVSEAAAWKGSLDRKPHSAKRFYAVMAVSMALGMGLNYLHLAAVKMLFWSAVVNGLLAPPLVLLVVLLTSDPNVMGPHVNSRTLRVLGWITFVMMIAAAAGMWITS